IDPDTTAELASFYQKQHQPDKAAAAFQRYVDKATDRVSVSNQCQWLVDYYVEHGQTDKALEVAEMAADVYSFRGLETYGRLLEQLHRFPEAETAFKNIADRYEDQIPLYLFYRRNPMSGGFGMKAEGMERAIFPAGIKNAALADFSGPPKTGVLITEENELLRGNGLKAGDIIVGFDGRRVDTFDQYAFIRSLSDSPAFHLVVYQDGKYRDLDVSIPNRRFGVGMETYVPR
ncbi:MAG TPA: hypothetical protein VNB29_03435, partial [Chthoniobacterales bacterium]|nr:hypothetical protein [Chthoniobacterales bacterium]